jgi:hypothetical protein
LSCSSPFWAERTAVWFAKVEAQFTLARINSEQIKFCYVITQLEHRYASEEVDIFTSPPKYNPYTTLKTELVGLLSPSKEQRFRDVLTLEELGDRKPSQFLRQLRSPAPELPDGFLRSIWASQLHSLIRVVLAGQPEVDLDTAAGCADRIKEAATQPSLASVTPLREITALRQQVEDLRRQVEALNTEISHSRSRSRTPRTSSRNSRKSSSSPS